MTTVHLPPIGAYAMERAPADARRRDVYRIAAIRGRVQTSVGALVALSPTITLEHVVSKIRTHVSAAKFAEHYHWEYAQ